ncbi:MAG: S46 family peptidase [Proteobacteria bacterium]|nr:MAG: S46 family peptidase [Pseudomonadota bacterium]
MLKSILASTLLFGVTVTGYGNEGQWQPHQLLELKKELKAVGINTPAEKLADLNKAPMTAIVSLGGCSASFVSIQGLVVTNHHCAYGDIQQNSSAANNYIANGFLAKTQTAELPGSPASRIYVTDKVENVSDRVLKGLKADASGLEYYEEIQKRIKALIAECEADKAYRCSVPSFHRGLEYYRIRQLMIRDVRLVYAPSDKVGNFGGEIDNFEWPRHTGDFAFLRAYVGKDGRPADPSPDNVPYNSKDFLKVSAEGLKSGDAILLAGYPGRTYRYKLPVEVRNAMSVSLPRSVSEAQADIDVIDKATAGKPESDVRYASVEKSIKNGMKRNQGFIDGFKRRDFALIKDEQARELRAWLSKQKNSNEQIKVLDELDALVAKDFALANEQFAWGVATNSDLLKTAMNSYRLAVEKKKADAERESGYQERDIPFIKSRLSRLEQTLVKEVDLARWSAALTRYQALDKGIHPQGLDALLPKSADLSKIFEGSSLEKVDQRLETLNQSKEALDASKDSIMQLAIKLHSVRMDLENRRKEIDGNLDRIVPRYMQSVIAWKKSQGKPVYPDANSTLRVTYGTVAAFSPVDGIIKGPFTTVQGILAKEKNEKPFEVPANLKEAIVKKQYGQFRDKVLGSVPVNFLTDADTTGGNSGSAVMNKNGDLVGLNFDSTYESVTKDWYFDPDMTRAIHVDIRYMLWVMKEVDKADNILKEMTVRYTK